MPGNYLIPLRFLSTHLKGFNFFVTKCGRSPHQNWMSPPPIAPWLGVGKLVEMRTLFTLISARLTMSTWLRLLALLVGDSIFV